MWHSEPGAPALTSAFHRASCTFMVCPSREISATNLIRRPPCTNTFLNTKRSYKYNCISPKGPIVLITTQTRSFVGDQKDEACPSLSYQASTLYLFITTTHLTEIQGKCTTRTGLQRQQPFNAQTAGSSNSPILVLHLAYYRTAA